MDVALLSQKQFPRLMSLRTALPIHTTNTPLLSCTGRDRNAKRKSRLCLNQWQRWMGQCREPREVEWKCKQKKKSNGVQRRKPSHYKRFRWSEEGCLQCTSKIRLAKPIVPLYLLSEKIYRLPLYLKILTTKAKKKWGPNGLRNKLFKGKASPQLHPTVNKALRKLDSCYMANPGNSWPLQHVS